MNVFLTMIAEHLTLDQNFFSGSLNYLCNVDGSGQSWGILGADCLGEVECSCCTFCCSQNEDNESTCQTQ